MSKVTLNDIANPESQTSLVQTVNHNNTLITEALDNTLSRDGTTPNSMGANLDMNTYRVLNLPEPIDNSEPLRLGDIGGLIGLDLPSIVEVAGYAESAANSAAEAASYVGSAVSAPKWTTGRTITLTGDVTGVSATWDGSANISFSTSIAADTISDIELTSGAAEANLGYTPVNKSGDVLSGDLRLNFTATSLMSDSVGFRGIPVTTQDNTYTMTVNDIGRMVRHTSSTAHVWYVDNVSTVAYPVGAAIVVRNVGSGAVTLARGAGCSLRKAGTATDANVTLAQWGMATLIHEDTNTWLVSGTGIT